MAPPDPAGQGPPLIRQRPRITWNTWVHPARPSYPMASINIPITAVAWRPAGSLAVLMVTAGPILRQGFTFSNIAARSSHTDLAGAKCGRGSRAKPLNALGCCPAGRCLAGLLLPLPSAAQFSLGLGARPMISDLEFGFEMAL